MHRDVEAADQMLAKLSDLLRMALDQRGGQEVTLKDELEFLQKYLEIEQARSATACGPLRHRARDARRAGAEPSAPAARRKQCSSCGRRAHRARPHRDPRAALRTTSTRRSDNGPGMPPRPAPPGKGVGLANTRSRLERLYGANHQLLSASRPAAALMVTVTIPFSDETEVAESDAHSPKTSKVSRDQNPNARGGR